MSESETTAAVSVDTPLPSPPSRLDVWKGFIGDLARPFSVISTSLSASIAVVIIAWRVNSFEGAAVFIGAVFAGVGAIYTAKSWEVAKSNKASADIEIAKAANTGTTS